MLSSRRILAHTTRLLYERHIEISIVVIYRKIFFEMWTYTTIRVLQSTCIERPTKVTDTGPFANYKFSHFSLSHFSKTKIFR